MSDTMKAVVFTKYGSLAHMQLTEVLKPVPKDNEVLVKVHASSINSWDWEFQSGTSKINHVSNGLLKPRLEKRILGSDVAGLVEAVGACVSRFKPGDAVFGDLWDNWGGFAEYACADENSLERKPNSLTFEQAAAVPQAGGLAWQGLYINGEIRPGQKILVNGAGGGVGTFAIQIAKFAGAEVTGVDKGDKLTIVQNLGADHVIDYTKEDFTQNGERYDLVVDVQVCRSIFDCKRALTPTGTYAIVGGSMSRVYQALLFRLWEAVTHQDKKIRLVLGKPNKGLPDLAALLEAGKVTPVIDRIYTLQDAAEALHCFALGQHEGKIVIAIRGL